MYACYEHVLQSGTCTYNIMCMEIFYKSVKTSL